MLRPRRFLLCAEGVYADHRLYPLGRGVWEWFSLNVGPPPPARSRSHQAGVPFPPPPDALSQPDRAALWL